MSKARLRKASDDSPPLDAMDDAALRARVEELKREFTNGKSVVGRLAALGARLEILRAWLACTQQRLSLVHAGDAGGQVATLAAGDSQCAAIKALPDASTEDEVGTDLDPDAPLWVRLVQKCEIEGAELPAGVIVEVPRSRVAELLSAGIAVPLVAEFWASVAAASGPASDGVASLEADEQRDAAPDSVAVASRGADPYHETSAAGDRADD